MRNQRTSCVSYRDNEGAIIDVQFSSRDVDIVVEIAYDSSDSSIGVLDELFDILKEKSIYSSATLQRHSIGIEMQGIDIDVVPVIRSDDGEIFCIGSSDIDEWTLTDPKGHIKWSSETNADNATKYKPLVKILKWWRRQNCPENKKFPKGITLKKIIADCLPNSFLNIENYLIGAMENIVSKYRVDYVDKGIMPTVDDPCLYGNDLLFGYTFSDFSSFILLLDEHLTLIDQDALRTTRGERYLGKEFPQDEQSASALRMDASRYSGEQFIENMFPVKKRYSLKIDCNVTQDGWRPFSLLRFLSGGGYLSEVRKLNGMLMPHRAA